MHVEATSVDVQAANEVLHITSKALQEESAKRQQAELEQQRIAATLAKEKEHSERSRKQVESERNYFNQRREADAQAMQAKISEMKAVHDIEITKKNKEQELERQRALDELHAVQEEFLKFKAMYEADQAKAVQQAENQSAQAQQASQQPQGEVPAAQNPHPEPRVMWQAVVQVSPAPQEVPTSPPDTPQPQAGCPPTPPPSASRQEEMPSPVPEPPSDEQMASVNKRELSNSPGHAPASKKRMSSPAGQKNITAMFDLNSAQQKPEQEAPEAVGEASSASAAGDAHLQPGQAQEHDGNHAESQPVPQDGPN